MKGRMMSGPSRTSETLCHTFIWLTDLWTDEIYLAHDILLDENVIIKLELVEGKHHDLHHKYRVYTKLSGGPGIPRVRWFGMEAGYYAMALDHLGPSLEDLFV
jgi:hypothetical protein